MLDIGFLWRFPIKTPRNTKLSLSVNCGIKFSLGKFCYLYVNVKMQFRMMLPILTSLLFSAQNRALRDSGRIEEGISHFHLIY